MDELIYRFLLQSGYPRASLVTDLDLLPIAGDPNAPGTGVPDPALAVVDPGTGDRLAIVGAVGPVDADALRATGSALADYARRFGGTVVQGFLVRVDDRGRSPDEQVQFYRVWPNDGLERFAAEAFPDFEAMRTWQLLAERRERGVPGAPGAASGPVAAGETSRPGGRGGRAALNGTNGADGTDDHSAARGIDDAAVIAARAEVFGDEADGAYDVMDGWDGSAGRAAPPSPGGWRWLPGIVLAALAVADVLVERLADADVLNASQAVLVTGAAALLLGAAFVRRG